jgi:hypothetical protein
LRQAFFDGGHASDHRCCHGSQSGKQNTQSTSRLRNMLFHNVRVNRFILGLRQILYAQQTEFRTPAPFIFYTVPISEWYVTELRDFNRHGFPEGKHARVW